MSRNLLNSWKSSLLNKPVTIKLPIQVLDCGLGKFRRNWLNWCLDVSSDIGVWSEIG